MLHTVKGQNQGALHNPERVMVYIDGFNLYFGMKKKDWQRYYWLDVCALARNLLKPSQTLVGVRYFTARISGPPSKQRRQNTYLEALGTLEVCKLHFGQYQSAGKTCVKCGHTAYIPSEKMTDVNIAVEMLSEAFADRYDTAMLVSGDSDLTPPVQKVPILFPSKRVVVAFPPERYSVRLQNEASASFKIGRKKLADSQLPEQITKPNGYILERPISWN